MCTVVLSTLIRVLITIGNLRWFKAIGFPLALVLFSVVYRSGFLKCGYIARSSLYLGTDSIKK